MAAGSDAVAEEVLQLVWDGNLRMQLVLDTRTAKTSDLLASEGDGRALGLWCNVLRRLPLEVAVSEALISAGLEFTDIADGYCFAEADGRVLPIDLPIGTVWDMLGSDTRRPSCLSLRIVDAPADADGGVVSKPLLLGRGPAFARSRFLHRLKQAAVQLEDSAARVVEASVAAKDAAWGALRAGHRRDAVAVACSGLAMQADAIAGKCLRTVAVPVRVVAVAPPLPASPAAAPAEAPSCPPSSAGAAAAASPVSATLLPATPASDTGTAASSGAGLVEAGLVEAESWHGVAQPRVLWGAAAGRTAADVAEESTGRAARRVVCEGVDVAALPLLDVWRRFATADGFVYLVVHTGS